MRAIIIDDEVHCVDTLSKMLEKYTDIELVASFSNSVEAVKKLHELEADILFLDIEMPFINGFELLTMFQPYPWKVVFTTAYDEYAIKAFKVNAVDYLLKPIPKSDLLKAIENCKTKSKESIQNQIELSVNSGLNQMIRKIAIPSLSGLEMINPDHIIYLESDSNYTKIHLKTRDSLLVSKTLKTFEELLSSFGFIRIHHSCIVNPIFIKRYVKGDGGYIVLEDDQHLNVSRSRKEGLLSALKSPGIEF